MNCAMPWALSPLRVRGPTASGRNRLSCQITRAKNSSGRPCARAAASIMRHTESRRSAGRAIPLVGSFPAGTAGVSLLPGGRLLVPLSSPWLLPCASTANALSASSARATTADRNRWNARLGDTAADANSGLVQRDPVQGAADDPPDVGVRQEQVVIDDAPSLRRSIDHMQAKLFELGFFRCPDARHPAREPTGHG